MYIPHQGLQTIHQDTVNASLERSKQRRMFNAAKQQIETEAASGIPRTGLRDLLNTVRAAVVRP